MFVFILSAMFISLPCLSVASNIKQENSSLQENNLTIDNIKALSVKDYIKYNQNAFNDLLSLITKDKLIDAGFSNDVADKTEESIKVLKGYINNIYNKHLNSSKLNKIDLKYNNIETFLFDKYNSLSNNKQLLLKDINVNKLVKDAPIIMNKISEFLSNEDNVKFLNKFSTELANILKKNNISYPLDKLMSIPEVKDLFDTLTLLGNTLIDNGYVDLSSVNGVGKNTNQSGGLLIGMIGAGIALVLLFLDGGLFIMLGIISIITSVLTGIVGTIMTGVNAIPLLGQIISILLLPVTIFLGILSAVNIGLTFLSGVLGLAIMAVGGPSLLALVNGGLTAVGVGGIAGVFSGIAGVIMPMLQSLGSALFFI
jgi:hypothetical protein